MTPRSAAIARQGPTFASWSRVVTTISSPGASVAADGAADVERQRRHVRAELDLVGRRRREVGERGMGVVDRASRRSRRAGTRRRGSRSTRGSRREGLDDAVRDLRAAGAVEERDRPAAVLDGEGRERRAERSTSNADMADPRGGAASRRCYRPSETRGPGARPAAAYGAVGASMGGPTGLSGRGLGRRGGTSSGARSRVGGDLVEREVDLELDLLADEPAAGLEGDVPGQAPVLAVELRRGVEAGAPALEPSCCRGTPRRR